MKSEFLEKKIFFSSLVEHLHECNHLSIADEDKAIRQYNCLIENKGFLGKAQKFSIQDDRLDDFYA